MVLVLRLKKKDLMSGFSKEFKEFKKRRSLRTTTTSQTKLCNRFNGEINRAAHAAPIVVYFCAAFHKIAT